MSAGLHLLRPVRFRQSLSVLFRRLSVGDDLLSPPAIWNPTPGLYRRPVCCFPAAPGAVVRKDGLRESGDPVELRCRVDSVDPDLLRLMRGRMLDDQLTGSKAGLRGSWTGSGKESPSSRSSRRLRWTKEAGSGPRAFHDRIPGGDGRNPGTDPEFHTPEPAGLR